jgi:hypothetical protein
MTELLTGVAEVRTGNGGSPVAVRVDGAWRVVEEVALTWRVETDWWRTPVRRDYMRCLLRGGTCADLYRDRIAGTWHWERRYD